MTALKSPILGTNLTDSTELEEFCPSDASKIDFRARFFRCYDFSFDSQFFGLVAVTAARAKILAVTLFLAENGRFARLNNTNNSSTRQH